MKEWISTFSKGINQDTNVNKVDNMSVFDCQNFRLTSKDSLSTGALTPVDGGVGKLSFTATDIIRGHCVIRDTMVLFVESTEGGKIYKWTNDGTDYASSPTLVYQSPDLIFDKPIRAVGHYETAAIQKIYFTDTETFFKHMNIMVNNLGKDSDTFDIVNNITFSTISLEMRVGGNMKAGKIQYAYQLYSVNGSESCFSPTSQLIHLTESSEGMSTLQYSGSEVGTKVNKSIQVTVNDIDPLFTRLRLIALEYTVFSQVPSIRLVGEYTVEGLSEITILDTGESNGDYTLEEFRFIQNDLYPKSLDIKDNRLFIANISNNYFEITDQEFDARAFRFHINGDCYVNYADPSLQMKIDTVVEDGIIKIINVPPIEHEQFNTFNDTINDFSFNHGVPIVGMHQFKYNPDNNSLGGKGKNISYSFITNQVILDEGVKTYDSVGFPIITSEVSTPYENHANPLSKVGYMRDEIYRFGIVFFDKKGRQSFVKWIGDIRMPSNREMPFVEYINGKTYANILGIRFTVTIPEDVKAKISGYQIVRADRTSVDRTIITQGLVGYASVGTDNDEVGMLYNLASVPTVADCLNKRITVEKWTETVSNGISTGSVINSPSRPGVTEFNDKYLEFTSPEIAFNKTVLPKTDTFIETFGCLDTPDTANISGPVNRDAENKNWNLCTKYKNFMIPFNSQKEKVDILDNRLFIPKERGTSSRNAENDATISVLPSGIMYNNQCTNAPGTSNDNDKKYGLRGTHSLLFTNSGFDIPSSNTAWTGTDADRVFLANYRVHKRKSIYGGVSYQARNSTMYYPVGRFKRVSSYSVPVSGVHSFEIWHGGLPAEVTSANTATVYANSSRPVVGEFLYKDAALTQPWDTNGAVLFVDPPIYGTEVVGVAIVDTVEYDPGEIMLLTGWHINSGYETDMHEDIEDVYDGDTYINNFFYLRSIWDNLRREGDLDGDPAIDFAGTGTIQSIVIFPVESSINIDLRLDQIQRYMQWGFVEGGWLPNYKLAETRALGVSRWGTSYPQDLGDLYRYNSVYSAIDKSKEYIPKPFDFSIVTKFDTRIAVSEKKINNEYIDSWLKFKFNEYLDVDSTHGPICRILTFKNNLFYFQSTGVGVASVNQKVLLTDNNPGALSVGTGGILDRFDYITEQSGSDIYDAIVASDRNIYYADNRRKRINKLLGEGEAAISVIKGIDSLLDKKPFTIVVAGFDRAFNEVLFNVDGKTIAFNEVIDAFMSTYTMSPSMIISIGKDTFTVESYIDDTPWLVNDIPQNVDYDSNGNYILISDAGTGGSIVKLNVGPKGNFSGSGSGGASDSYVTLIINPNGNVVNSFDTLDIRTESTDDFGNDILTDIFYKLEASNAYQSITRNLNFSYNGHESSGTIKRVGRVWRTPIVPTPGTGIQNRPMVDTYIKVTLTYSNANNYNFKVHDITTYYRPKSI